MRAIQEAVAACLQERTGVKTVLDRALCRVYPMLAVSVREDGTTLLAGGKQAEHKYLVTVTAASDRDRAGNTELLASLPPVLLRGIPMEREGEVRVLHPLNICTEGEELTFVLALCVPVPQPLKPGETEPGIMEVLHMEI